MSPGAGWGEAPPPRAEEGRAAMGALLVAIERLTEAVDRNTAALTAGGGAHGQSSLAESIAEALQGFLVEDEDDEEDDEEDEEEAPPPRRRRRR